MCAWHWAEENRCVGRNRFVPHLLMVLGLKRTEVICARHLAKDEICAGSIGFS